MKLIDEWKHAWKFLSIQGMALAATVQVAWVSLPDDWRGSLPHNLVSTLTIVCLALGIVGRVVQQAPVVPDDGKDA